MSNDALVRRGVPELPGKPPGRALYGPSATHLDRLRGTVDAATPG